MDFLTSALEWFAKDAPEALKVAAFCAVPAIGFWVSTGPYIDRYHKWYSRKPSDSSSVESMKLVNVTTRNISIGFASYMVWKECGYSFEEASIPLAPYASLLILYWTYHPVLLGLKCTRWGVWHSAMTTIAAAAALGYFWRVCQPAGVSMIPFFFYISSVTLYNWRQAQKEEKLR